METQKSPEMPGVGRELVVSRPGSIAEQAVAPSSQAQETSTVGGWQLLWGPLPGPTQPPRFSRFISSLSLSNCSCLSYEMSFGASVQTPVGGLPHVLVPTGRPSQTFRRAMLWWRRCGNRRLAGVTPAPWHGAGEMRCGGVPLANKDAGRVLAPWWDQFDGILSWRE